ncbi:hypothetical protein [Bacillus gaemokensis]|nr:hypothetical protein [Bacillus gaemokensis]
MGLDVHWLEHKIIQEYIEYDMYTILNLYKDMIKICKQEGVEKTL